MKEEGIEFLVNTDVGKDITLENIMEIFDATLLTTGANWPRGLPIPGWFVNIDDLVSSITNYIKY